MTLCLAHSSVAAIAAATTTSFTIIGTYNKNWAEQNQVINNIKGL